MPDWHRLGYYEEGAFGVRIENVVEVVAVLGNDGFFGFEPVTLFPIQVSLRIPVSFSLRMTLEWCC